MNVSPTLSKDEFKEVHNAKCEFHQVQQALEELGIVKLAERMRKALQLMQHGLASAYKQDDEAFVKANDDFTRIRQAEGFTSSRWSIYETAGKMGEVPYPKAKLLVYDQYATIGVPLPVRPTWVDLWRAADSLIQKLEGTNYVFIEGFTPTTSSEETLSLHTGS